MRKRENKKPLGNESRGEIIHEKMNQLLRWIFLYIFSLFLLRNRREGFRITVRGHKVNSARCDSYAQNTAMRESLASPPRRYDTKAFPALTMIRFYQPFYPPFFAPFASTSTCDMFNVRRRP